MAGGISSICSSLIVELNAKAVTRELGDAPTQAFGNTRARECEDAPSESAEKDGDDDDQTTPHSEKSSYLSASTFAKARGFLSST